MLVGALGFGCANDHSLKNRFFDVKRGDTEPLVVRAMGAPDETRGRPRYVAWGGDPVHPNNGECVKEFFYRPIVNLLDEAYSVGFDANGKVVSKYHYVSQ